MAAGYDVEVIESYQDGFNCSICCLLIKDATHGCLNHVFCQHCLKTYLEKLRAEEKPSVCPGGCSSTVDSTKLTPSIVIDLMINKLKCKCSNELCIWEGDLIDLVQVHRDQCDYLLQACSRDDCKVTYTKSNADAHEDSCLFKLIQCAFCSNSIIRQEKENHEALCSKEMVACAYFDIGCQDELCREELTLHETTFQSMHMKLLYTSLTKKTVQIEELKNDNNELKESLKLLKDNEVKDNNLQNFENHIETNSAEIIKLKAIMDLKIVNMEEKLNKAENSNATNELNIAELQYNNFKLANEASVVRKELSVMKEATLRKKDIDRILKKVQVPRLKEQISQVKVDSVKIHEDDFLIVFSSLTPSFEQLLKSYKSCKFTFMIEDLEKMSCYKFPESLLVELFYTIPYHFYLYPRNRIFCFPVEYNKMNDFKFNYGSLKIHSRNNELMIEYDKKATIKIYIEHYEIEIIDGVAINLFQIAKQFTKDYACLHLQLNN